MEKIEIIGNTDLVFETENIAYQLSTLLDTNTWKYSYVSLDFIKDYGMTHEKYIESWDNDTFLIETLYENVLTSWIGDKSISSPEIFADLLKIDGVRLEDFEGIYELFNKAIEMKFFEK